MQPSRVWLSVVGLLAAAALPAQNQAPCRHLMPQEIEPSIITTGSQNCGVGFRGLIGGIELQVGNMVCPVMVLITPRHSVPVMAAAETDVAITGQVPNVLVTFKCYTSHFLFIPIGDSCSVLEIRDTGAVDNYGLAPCTPTAEQTE